MSLILSVIFAASVSSQDLNRLVSAEVRAASAPIAIAELSKQVGYPLEAMSSTKDDILIIKVDKAPLKELLNRIAKATNTEWEQTATGMRLVRTDAIRRQEKAEEHAVLTKEIQESFNKMAKRLTEDGELTERGAGLTAERLVAMNERQSSGSTTAIDWRDHQRLNSQAPAYRLLRKISPNLDAATLASIPNNRNIVFSTQPTRMQRPMPGNIQPLLQTFVKEQTIWAKAIKTARERRGGQNNYYFENMADPSQSKIGKVLLILHRSEQSRGIQLRLSIADEKGRAMGSAQESLGWSWEDSNKELQEAQKDSANEEAMKFTGATKLIAESMQEAFKAARQNNGQPKVDLSPEAKEVLLNPDKIEPLSLIASEAFFETARIKKLNVVCSAPDMLMFGVGPMVEGSPKPAAFMASLKIYAVDTQLKDGWLVAKPHVSSEIRAQRTDRVVLGQYLRRAVKEGRITIDNRAEFAYRSGKEQEDYMPMFLLTMLGLIGNEMYGGEWDALRLYGSLTANQRQLAKAGQPIPFRSLQPGQLEIIRHVVFDSPWSRLSMNYEASDWAEMQNDDGVYHMAGLSNEATEILPNGFTGTETLTITEQNEPKFFAKPDSEAGTQMYYGEQAYDTNSLAYEIFQNERPELFPWRNQPGYPKGAITKLRMGTQRQVTFQATLTKRASMHMQLTDKSYQGAEMSVDKLPADVKKQIQDNLAKIREQHKNAKAPNWNPGGGGGVNPPPPATRRAA